MGESAPNNSFQSHVSVPSVALEHRVSNEEIPLQNTASNQVELFPDKVQKPPEERITGKTLAERIQDNDNTGVRELFPELVRRGGGTRGRRKAEDHFWVVMNKVINRSMV